MTHPTSSGQRRWRVDHVPLRGSLGRRRKFGLVLSGISLVLGGAGSVFAEQHGCPPGWSEYQAHPSAAYPCRPHAPYPYYIEPPQPPRLEETEPGAAPDQDFELTPPTEPTEQFPVQDFGPSVADLGDFGATRGGLSAAPGMIGDQFGSSSGACSVLVFSVGPAIHHTFPLGGIDDLHVIEFTNSDQTQARFLNGPTSPPFFVLPNFQGPPPPLGSTVTGLIDGATGEGPFTATQSDQAVDIPSSENNGIEILDAAVYFITREIPILVPSPSGGSGAVLGRQKIAENNSPIPRDRVFFNYSYFHNTQLAPGGLDVNRYTPGFEKTFWDRVMSVEARFPFASTLDTDLNLDLTAGAANAVPEDVEFGNVSVIFKVLMWETATWGFSGGVQVVLPTGKDVRVGTTDGTSLVEVTNDAAHLAPFLGAVYSNGRLFTQGYVQIDAGLRGNRVFVNDPLDTANELEHVGDIEDATFLYADWGLGYWLLRNPDAYLLTGAAPLVELHWNQSLEETDVLRANMFQIGTEAEDISVLNAVVGGVLQLGGQSTLSIGYATPIGASADREFDGEFRLVFNRYFGPTFNVP